jgi:hypothetical protein
MAILGQTFIVNVRCAVNLVSLVSRNFSALIYA